MKFKSEWHHVEDSAWDNIDDNKKEESKDVWVDHKPNNEMPIASAVEPAEIIEINARCFKVEEFYLDHMIKNIKSQPDIKLTTQDKDLLFEINEG